MEVLGIDVETTGLDFKTDFITEIGTVVWDTATKRPLNLTNNNLKWPDAPPQSKEIIELTGIDDDLLARWGTKDVESVLKGLAARMSLVPVCVAHNAPFDRGMIEAAFSRCDIICPKVTWIDTCVDLPFTKDKKARKLAHAAAEHGINPNRFAHRALFDVMQMFELMSCYDFDCVLTRSRSANVTIEALCEKPWIDKKPEGKKDTDIAKENGFRFNGADKTWYRNCKEFEVDEITSNLPFRIRIKSES